MVNSIVHAREGKQGKSQKRKLDKKPRKGRLVWYNGQEIDLLPALDKKADPAFIKQFLSSVDHPRALTVWLLYESGEHAQLAHLPFHPESQLDEYEVVRDYTVSSLFLSKYKRLKTGINTERVALDKFQDAELQCWRTNQRIRGMFQGQGPRNAWDDISSIREKIHRILGEAPSREELLESSNWGPGATLSIPRDQASHYRKYLCERGITQRALEYIGPDFDEYYPLMKGRMFQVELGDRLLTVDKNAKTDRMILIQPGWNLWFQKGIGKMIRRRLRRFGLDLNQQEWNNILALVGSDDGSLSTIDMKAASDTISLALVYAVMPNDWLDLLVAFRTSCSEDGNPWFKFSAMGNGYTFELESLIFLAVALVACDKAGETITLPSRGTNPSPTVSVYGDDVILPTGATPVFIDLCNLCGFVVNNDKSFFREFPFRESCGGYYFRGRSITTTLLKEGLLDVEDVYWAHNSTREVARRVGDSLPIRDKRFDRVLKGLKALLPKPLRFVIPFGFGDIGFVGDFDEALPRKPRDIETWEGFYFTGYCQRPVKWKGDGDALLCVRLRSGGNAEQEYFSFENLDPLTLKVQVKQIRETLGEGNFYSVKNRTIPYINNKVYVSNWPKRTWDASPMR